MEEKKMPLFLQKGMRKVAVLAPALGVAELAGIVALFSGHLPPESFESYTIGVLSWGGGIFAGANVLEHLAKSFSARAE